MNIPKTRFSPQYTQGTYKERMQFADRLNDLLFSNIFPLYERSLSVPLCDIEEKVKQIMPEPIPFSIEKNNDKKLQHYAGYLRTRFINKKTNSYTIIMPAEDDRMHRRSIFNFMHESAHLWTNLLYPKINKNQEKMLECGIFEKIHNFFFKEYNTGKYSYNKFMLTRSTKKVLKNMPTEQKLMSLNFIRYRLMNEIHAYEQGQKYAEKMNNLGYNFYALSPDDLALRKKLKLVNKITTELIRKERYKHAQKKAQTKREKFNNFIGYHFSDK